MADRTGQQLGNYRLLRMIGQGGYAEVYLGEHVRLNTQAAIKILHAQLDDEYTEDFLKEAQIIARLVHPHIIRIYDFDVQNGLPFLVMEYASHGTLRQRHPSGKPVPLHTIVDYTNQIAGALQYANEQGIIHRDIKPANMLVGRHNDILLSDFGIALIAMNTHTIELQKIAGTPVYMAPEQFQGKTYMASDQYSLGIIAYEWLCGKAPFQGSFYELASQHHSVPPPSLRDQVPHLPVDVEQVIMTALHKDPKKRFGSIRAFANALEQASHSTPRFFTPLPPTNITPPNLGLSNQPPLPQVVPPAFPVAPAPAPTAPAASFPISDPGAKQPVLPGMPAPAPTVPAASLPISEASAKQLVQTHTSPQTAPAGTFTTPGVQTVLEHPLEQPAKQTRQQRQKALRILLPIVLVLFLAGTAIYVLHSILGASKTIGGGINAGSGIGVTRMPDGTYIGLSDGTFAFDTAQPDGSLKLQAADKLKTHDVSGAESLWRAALQKNTSDAEALIYLEDQRVLAAHAPYITLVVATYLTGPSLDIGRSNLQGAYVAQKEFNEQAKLPGGVQIRLLVASSGGLDQYVTPVAQRIVHAARTDATIVGVMGWPMSISVQNALSLLGAAHLPVVSPAATADALTGASPYFFRVVPSDKQQVLVEAQYAERTLHATSAAVFIDPQDSYSQEMATDFTQQFQADGKTIVATEQYQVKHPATLASLLQDALTHNPNLLYFAGSASDASALMAALPTSGPFASLQVIGPDHLFGSYPSRIASKMPRLHLTILNTGHMWESLGLAAHEPVFFNEYPQDFDPLKQHDPNALGFTHADSNVMLSYDAILALLSGSKIALNALPAGHHLFSPDELRQAVAKITLAQPVQGVTGQLAFGPDGNVVNKVVILVKFTATGVPRIDSVQGTFQAGT